MKCSKTSWYHVECIFEQFLRGSWQRKTITTLNDVKNIHVLTLEQKSQLQRLIQDHKRTRCHPKLIPGCSSKKEFGPRLYAAVTQLEAHLISWNSGNLIILLHFSKRCRPTFVIADWNHFSASSQILASRKTTPKAPLTFVFTQEGTCAGCPRKPSCIWAMVT